MSDKTGSEAKHGRCKSCGSEMERESGYMVCTGCGDVDESRCDLADDHMQSIIANDSQLFSKQPVNSSMRNALLSHSKTTTSLTPSRQMGMKIAETLAVNYSFNSEMKEDLMQCYNKALVHKNFYKCSLRNKEILAAVCAYITLMRHNHIIAIQYICSSIDCNGFDFNQIYALFVKSFPHCKADAKPIEELVASVLTDLRINNQEMKDLEHRVIDIISIEKACWLVEGRSPLHVITAATYLGWKSLRPTQRAHYKFTQFCKDFGIRSTLTTVERVKEQNDIFIKLAKHIPIVKFRSIRVHRNNVALYVNDIIQYSNSLIFDLRRDVYTKLCEEQKSSQRMTKDDDYSEDNDKTWMNSFKRKAYYETKGQNRSYESEVRKEGLENEEPEESEPHISDDEIDRYLRSDKEIKFIKKAYKRMNKRITRESKEALNCKK